MRVFFASLFSTLVAGYPHTWREVESEGVLASLFSTLVAGYPHTWREVESEGVFCLPLLYPSGWIASHLGEHLSGCFCLPLLYPSGLDSFTPGGRWRVRVFLPPSSLP